MRTSAPEPYFVYGSLRHRTRATEYSICNLSSFTSEIIRGFYRGGRPYVIWFSRVIDDIHYTHTHTHTCTHAYTQTRYFLPYAELLPINLIAFPKAPLLFFWNTMKVCDSLINQLLYNLKRIDLYIEFCTEITTDIATKLNPGGTSLLCLSQ